MGNAFSAEEDTEKKEKEEDADAGQTADPRVPKTRHRRRRKSQTFRQRRKTPVYDPDPLEANLMN